MHRENENDSVIDKRDFEESIDRAELVIQRCDFP
jgi:hypothetical protein